MSREQYEAQFNSLSKAFTKAKRRSAAGGEASGATGKTKDEMAHFVGMLMDLVGVFKEDKMLDKTLPMDDPRMTFSMIFGGAKGMNMGPEEEEEWSTDEDDDDGNNSEPDEDECPKLEKSKPPASQPQHPLPIQQPVSNHSKKLKGGSGATTPAVAPAESRKVTEAEAEATAEELAAAEAAREKKKMKNAKKKAEKKKKMKERKESDRATRRPSESYPTEKDDNDGYDENDDEDDDAETLYQLKQAFVAASLSKQKFSSSSSGLHPSAPATPSSTPSTNNSAISASLDSPSAAGDSPEDFVVVGKKSKRPAAAGAATGTKTTVPHAAATSPSIANTGTPSLPKSIGNAKGPPPATLMSKQPATRERSGSGATLPVPSTGPPPTASPLAPKIGHFPISSAGVVQPLLQSSGGKKGAPLRQGSSQSTLLVKTPPSSSSSPAAHYDAPEDNVLSGLLAMGFPLTECLQAINTYGRNNVDTLVSFLIEGPHFPDTAATKVSPVSDGKVATATSPANTVVDRKNASAAKQEIDRKEEMRRINREWNQKAEDDKRKVR